MKSLKHKKNDFIEVPKNLSRHIFENNFVWNIKLICKLIV